MSAEQIDFGLSDADLREILTPDEYAKALAPVIEPGAQGSPQWLADRIGYCSGSRFADVLAKLKNGKPAKARDDYLMELVVMRVTDASVDHYVSAAMQWGTDNEPLARLAYEAATGAMVEEQGFIRHPTLPMCGGSVDGFVGDDGIIEIKAPTTATHIKTLLAKSCEEHYAQIHGYLWITGRQWCDFISYDPRMPKGLDLYVQRVNRDDDFIAHLAGEVMQFLTEVDAQVAAVRKMIDKQADARPA